MPNEQNIIPHQFTSAQSREEAAKNGRKGGQASGAARRAKRDAKLIAQQVLSMKPNLPPATLDTMVRMGMSEKAKPDMRMIASLAIMQRAMKGDHKAYEFLLALAGETADSELLQLKAAETRRRAGVDEIDSAPTTDIESVRRRMDEMSDEQLSQYEQLCDMLNPENEERDMDG